MLSSITHMNTAIGRPQMTQETCNTRRRLGEDAFRHIFFIRSQPKDADLVQPFGNRVPHTMCEMIASGKVDLIPFAFALDTRLDSIAENLSSKIGNHLRKSWIVRRVMNRLAW